jgi:hypothetical protein
MRIEQFVWKLAIILSFAGNAWSQESGAERLKGLDFLVGEWVAEYTMTNDIPEVGLVKGSRIVDRNTFRRTLNGNALELTISQTQNGESIPPSREVTCWDPDSRALVHTIYGEGFFGRGSWRQEGDTWVLDWQVSTTAGRTYKGRSNHRSLGPDEFTWQILDFTVDDKPMADGPLVHFKRVPPPLSPGQEKMKAFEFLIGEWEQESPTGTTTSVTYRWLNNQSFIEFRAGDYMEIMGWDPVNKRYVSWAFGTQGGYGLLVWSGKGDQWTVEADPIYYDRHGGGHPMRLEMKIIDHETMELSGRFGTNKWSAKARKVVSEKGEAESSSE